MAEGAEPDSRCEPCRRDKGTGGCIQAEDRNARAEEPN